MKTLNLVDIDKSDIKYQINKFPDGQQDILIEDYQSGDEFKWKESVLAYPVKIKSRFNSFRDLELIVCATKALKRLGFNNINLYVPYILGARSDRQFQEGGTSYLVDVVAPILNSLEFDLIECMDAHSDVAAACISNLKGIPLGNFYDWCHKDIDSKDFVLVSPDGGALKKIYKVADQIRHKGDVLECSKSRDENGQLTRTNVPYLNRYEDKDLIIVDDICDGGATFINIAKEIRKDSKHRGRIFLIVTHGIFSKGFGELSTHFDGIYSTNSVKDVLNTEWDGDKKDTPTKVKQLNIF